jgi:phage-related baseplate assembly protein
MWQKTKIGRDINPDELVKLVKEAGAKRVVVTSPVFTTIASGEVAKLTSQTVTYGGLEND